MKKIVFLIAVLLSSGCAPHQSTAWNMSWACYTNYCFFHVSPNSWGGNGSFDSQNSCLAWETVFLNTAGANGGGGVTSCNGN